MKKIAFFDTKPYDRTWFDILAKHYEIAYFEEKLNRHTATLTDGFDAVCAFVNDRVDACPPIPHTPLRSTPWGFY